MNTTSDIQYTIKSVSNISRYASKLVSNSSLAKLAQDSIFQMPLLVDAGIDTDDIMAIARSLELQYAAMVVSVLSLHPTIDLDKYPDIAHYLQQFHNNKDIPTNFVAAGKALLESIDPESNIESATVIDKMNLNKSSNLGKACWIIADEQIDDTILNDIYRPYEAVKEAKKETISSMTAATEILGRSNGPINEFGSQSENKMRGDQLLAGKITDKNGRPNLNQLYKTSVNAIVKNEKISSMEPTLLNVNFVIHGDGTNGVVVQPAVLGVKVMTRLVRPDSMIANMVEAVKNANFIFKFIKWTKGELSLVKNLLFNIDEIKDAAIKDKNNTKWLGALRRRKKINSISKFIDNRVLPSTTIIISKYTAERVKEITGVDLTSNHAALQLLHKYYLLGFGVFDTDTKILSLLLDDGNYEFSDVNITQLKQSGAKTVDLTNARDVARLIGRR